jgi:uncharacterized protein (TIGR00106 family)
VGVDPSLVAGDIIQTTTAPQPEVDRIFRQAGLNHQLHAYGTNVEGEWDDVMAAMKRCHEVVHEMGAVRISTTVRLGTRNDREQTMQDKLDSVARKLGE